MKLLSTGAVAVAGSTDLPFFPKANDTPKVWSLSQTPAVSPTAVITCAEPSCKPRLPVPGITSADTKNFPIDCGEALPTL